MDDLLHLVAAVLRWRVFAAVGAASGVAILGVRFVPWFSGLQGLALVVAALFVGLAWEAHTQGQPILGPSLRRTKPSVGSLAFLTGGALWGLVSSSALGATVFGALLAIMGLAVWSWVVVIHRHTLQPPLAALYALCLLVGYAIPTIYRVGHGLSV